VKPINKNKITIFFDGVCNLCNGLVDFILKRDKSGIFIFETIQSEYGQKILFEYDMNLNPMDTIVLIEGDKLYIKSKAIFRIINQLGGVWIVFLVFRIFPNSFNDYLYDVVSRNRYRIFGKRRHCRIIESASIKPEKYL